MRWLTQSIAQHELLSVKMLFDYCDCRLFLVSLATSVPKDKYNMWEKQKAWYFFSILNYWFTCLSSVGSPLFAKLFTLGNIISGISLNVQGFQTRSNCFEWKSLMKHGHSTKSNSPTELESFIQVLKSIRLWVRLSNKVELTQGNWNRTKSNQTF